LHISIHFRHSNPFLSSQFRAALNILVSLLVYYPFVNHQPLQSMGKLIWHELSRYISLTASVYAVRVSFWGFFFRKFFWDFIGGILRSPGGLQPSPKFALFINVIVKYPIVQIGTMALGFTIIALEYPIPILKGTAIFRSVALRVVLLIMQAAGTVLFYRVSIRLVLPVFSYNTIGYKCGTMVINCCNGLHSFINIERENGGSNKTQRPSGSSIADTHTLIINEDSKCLELVSPARPAPAKI